MTDATVVLGGWGVHPDVLRPLFGDDAQYIDSNSILPQLVINGRLQPDWPEITARILEPYRCGSVTLSLAGWSTGAILAYGAATFLAPARLLLASATLSFCRTPGFRHGMRPSVIAAMKERLQLDRQGVLDNFSKNCGFIKDHTSAPCPWTAAALSDGLTFLEQAHCDTLPLPRCPVSMVHGDHDRIIPAEAGRLMALHCSARFTLVQGEHACFTDSNELMKTLFTTIQEGPDNESI